MAEFPDFEESFENDDEYAEYDDDEAFSGWVAALPSLTPVAITQALRDLRYVGQDDAVRAVALSAHRHVRRLKAIHTQGIPRDALPDKQNLLLVGPTGCGKTYLVELLFREVLKIPTAIIDITAFSESGYVGQDVSTVITRLLFAAQGDRRKTEAGVICLDEFDKIASSQNRAVFAGQGTTKDVTGAGVQRELLKMLESATIPVPSELDHNTYQERVLLSTADIAFIACGAFSGLKSITHQRASAGIGFHGEETAAGPEEIAVRYSATELEDTVNFQEYGFLPELIGRFSRIVAFDPLARDTLKQILERNVIKNYALEFQLAGIELAIDERVMDRVVDAALGKQTGARGLRAGLIRFLESAAYEAYSRDDVKRIVLDVDGDDVKTTIEPKTAKKRRPAKKKSGPQKKRA